MSATSEASVSQAGDALRFAGSLVRAHVPALWATALPQLSGVRRFDLSGVTDLDSAGVALLAELAERAGSPSVEHAPPALGELCGAYRLTAQLGYLTSRN